MKNQTKTFKVGEYGYYPKVKLTTEKDKVRIFQLTNSKEIADSVMYPMNNLMAAELYLSEQTTSYYASKMVEWVKTTQNYKELNLDSQSLRLY